MKLPRHTACLPLLVLGLAGCQQDTAATSTGSASLSYNWDIRPIISDNCFGCHGPDAEGGQRAGLRLDLYETATGELPESPGKFAIVPGDADASELMRRISSDDPDVMMPPPDSNKTLSSEQKQLLATWIEQGAQYEAHWAYVPVQRPALPTPEPADGNAIDSFITSKLAEAGMQSAPQADPATLVNRVYMDLTGLPPTLEQVDAFVQDASPAAYESLVDELLASTAHAEHMTGQWLDLARWADTDGYLEDAGNRLLHPWRDWVIDAWQKNLPFDDFLTWQIAGDLLPDATHEQRLATTFLRMGQRSSENGIIDAEYKNEYAIDRVETIGSSILGHTVGCARCHDHKYDPIGIRDFYAFAAFFGSNREPGFYTPGGSMPAAAFLGVESGATLELPDAEAAARLDRLAARMQEEAATHARVRDERRAAIDADATGALPERAQVLQEISAALQSSLTAHYAFESLHDGDLDFAKIEIFGRQEQGKPMTVSRGMPAGIRENLVRLSPASVAGVVPAVLQSPLLVEGIKGQAFGFDDQNKGYFGGDVGDFDRTDAFTLDFWIKLAEVYDNATVLNHNQHIRFAANGYTIDIEDNHLRFDMVHTPDNRLSVKSTTALEPGAWHHVTMTYDGSSRAAGVKLWLDAEPLQLDVLGDNLSKTIVTTPLAFIDDTRYGLGFGKRWQQYTIAGSALDEVRVFNRDLSTLEIAWLQTDGEPQLTSDAYAQFRLSTDAQVLVARENWRAVAAEHNQLLSSLPEIMVMEENPLAPPMQVKKRGLYSDPGEAVAPQAFDQIFAWDDALPANRLGLAHWLFDRNNPLTSRVHANRLWQSLFGRGIVETSEDFGTQGANPTHPELLDWLAAELMDSGWDNRHLLKLMVLSQTYRQDSRVSVEALQADPDNRLLGRGVRLRYSAEQIRDRALAASGLLDSTVGGPSVHPYQPAGLWLSVSVNQIIDYPTADAVPVDEHHRRTLYGYVKRAAQHPALQVFDFPQRITTVPRRRISNTPLQALVLLNDQQYLEAYEGMAWQALQTSDDAQTQVQQLYRLALRREATEAELQVLTRHHAQALDRYQADADQARAYLGAGLQEFDVADADLAALAALASTARIVMNSPDAYTRH